MADSSAKEELHGYLRGARSALLWKLDGLGDYDIRRPMTPTGTNLLGLVKHSTATQLGYFGDVFGRATAASTSRFSGVTEPNAEFWATRDETRASLIAAFDVACDLADSTIDDLPLDAVGQVWWWGDATVTLQRVLVHVTAETQRHAGHADIVRELIDGSAGLLPDNDNLHLNAADAQERHRARVQAAADAFR